MKSETDLSEARKLRYVSLRKTPRHFRLSWLQAVNRHQYPPGPGTRAIVPVYMEVHPSGNLFSKSACYSDVWLDGSPWRRTLMSGLGNV